MESQLYCRQTDFLQRKHHDRMLEKFDRGEGVLDYFDLDAGVMKTPIS
jgi:hypothetical protein